MKRLLSCFLSFALLLPCLLLASCGGGATGGEDATGAPTGASWITFSINGEDHVYLVANGETPVCPEELLSWETEEHYYKVIGWDKEIVPVAGNATYVATVGEYGLTLYDVRFNLPSGMIKVSTHEGETPTPPAGYETDLSQVDKIGTFDRWSPELTAPTSENMEGKKTVVYTPVYTYATRYYTVSFNVRGTAYEVQTAGNTLPVCPIDPTRYEERTDKFVGWDREIVPATSDATYTAWYGSEAEILPVRDGAKGILTMTYDDGLLDTAKWVNKENKKYGLKGSCMLVAGRSALTDNLAEWRALFADGTLEPESHSMTHDTMPADWSSHYAGSKGNNIQPKYKYELVDSKTKLEELFPGHAVVGFAPGNNTLSTSSFAVGADGTADLSRPLSDGGAQAVANATYYAVRQGKYGLQSLDPASDANEGGWYNLKIQWFREWMNGKANGLTWLDDAVGNGGWLIVMCHAIYGEGAGSTGNKDLTTADADKFFARAGNYVKSGELWCATLGEATRYIRERQSATAYRKMENGTLHVGLKIERATSDGKPLPESVFNYPLTVKARVPSAWKTVSYELNGETITSTCYVDPTDGQTYANVNVVPGGDGAVSDVLVNRAD